MTSSFQESLFSKGKLVLALQRVKMGDVTFEQTTCLHATMDFQREKREEEKANAMAKAKVAEQLRTPSPSARASCIATPGKLPLRPAEDSLAELKKRLLSRRPLPPSGSEHQLTVNNGEAAKRLKGLLQDFSTSLASPLSSATVSRYVVGLLQFGVRNICDLAGVDRGTLVHKADMSRRDAQHFLRWLNPPSISKRKRAVAV